MDDGFACACCGYKTVSEPAGSGSYDICQVCYWEDDPVQFADPDYEGGANAVSLRQAQQNFIAFGVSEKRYAKCVKSKEQFLRDQNWKLLDG